MATELASVQLPEGVKFSPRMCAFLAKRNGMGPVSALRKAVHLRVPYLRRDLQRELEFQLERAQKWVEGKAVRSLKRLPKRVLRRAPSPSAIWDAASESDATNSAI